MQVAELVPEVSMAQCLSIGGRDVLAPGDRFEHPEVRGTWFVKAGEKAIDSAHFVR
jgi:hypothetical protein